jgi:2-oxoglutarate dehydrogenase E2 component (dihydrolipoamide succinyltransferase)
MRSANEVRAPRLNTLDEDYVVLEWLVQDGAAVAEGDALVAVETSKAVEEIAAPSAGRAMHAVAAGQRCRVGEIVARIVPEGAAADDSGTHQPPAAVVLGAESPDRPVAVAGPVITEPARRLAEELGVSTAALHAVGKAVIRADDVRAVAPAHRPTVAVAPHGEPVRLPRGQAAVAATAARSHLEIPAAFLVMEVGVDAAVAASRVARRRVRAMVGLTELTVLALGRLRADFPWAFAGTDDPSAPRVRPGAHVGVTVDVGSGLAVPVVPDADRATLGQVAARLTELRQRSQHARLSENDLRGANITLALAPEDGVVFSRPLVPPGQACVVSLPAVQERCVLEDGQPRARRVVHLGLAYDHRVLNGREAAAFLTGLRGLLEAPEALVDDA